MNKIKRFIITIIFMIIAIVSFSTVSKAYNVGQYITINYNQYVSSSRLLCIQHGQRLWSEGRTYKVVSKVTIVGNKSKDHDGKEITSKHNAKLAYILTSGSSKSAIQNSIWNYLRVWMSNVGKNHAGLSMGLVAGNYGTPQNLQNKAENYANSYKEDAEIKDNTDKTKIQVKPVTVKSNESNDTLLKVGPFKWNFDTPLDKVEIYDDNGKKLSIENITTFSGKEEKSIEIDKIKSDKNVYFTVKPDTNTSKISKVYVKTTEQERKVTIEFYKCLDGAWQNMMRYYPSTAPVEIEAKFDYDIKIQGDLNVIKVDANNNEVKLQNVGFVIENKALQKYVNVDSNGNVSYVDRSAATEFKTDENGKIEIKNLVVGTYVAYETDNPNKAYEILNEGKEVDVTIDKTAELNIPNTVRYITISGYVWEDIREGKQDEKNNLNDSNDILLNGISVRLKDKNGNTVQETKTSKLDMYTDVGNDGNGEYKFENVDAKKLNEYYVEFEYDGLVYTNVLENINENTGSKAKENQTSRDNFNNKFAIIENDVAKDINGNKTYDLSYTTENHESKLENNGQFILTSNTNETGYSTAENGLQNRWVAGSTELRFVNLGLVRREETDLRVDKNIKNAKLTINGYSHLYNYTDAKRDNKVYEYDGQGFNVGVKFGTEGQVKPYTRAIYKADVDYENSTNKDKELKVYITYKIAMINETTNLVTKFNSLVDYYDSKYTLKTVGTDVDSNGDVTGKVDYQEGTYNDKYKKVIIATNQEVNVGETKYIYLQFEMSREVVKNIMFDANTEYIGENTPLDNVVEITSYSTLKDGKAYASIDKDSNPGNAIPGNYETYEDDTDAAPSLILELADARTITGKVFLDATDDRLLTAQIRQGSGKYEDGEKGIAGVQVILRENETGKTYGPVTTDENGDFTISGFIPGKYTLVYTWGDDTYTVQNYKGTVYNDQRDQGLTWYKTDIDTRYSDAKDNYETRKNIDAQITTGVVIGEKITKMDSSTPTMEFGIEFESTYSDSTGDKYEYKVKNVDFGIVERPRQAVTIDKKAVSLKITLANNSIIVDAKVDENGNLTGQKDFVTGGPSYGWIKAEIDKELMQGATLKIGYKITVKNISEKDYTDQNFYLYGIVPDNEQNIVTITPTGVYDYLDNTLVQEENGNWKTKTIEEYNQEVSPLTIKEEWVKEENKTVDENGNILITIKEEGTATTSQVTEEQWMSQTIASRTTEFANKTLLYQELTKKVLKPGEDTSVELNATKLLSNSEQNNFNNESEIVKIEKTGGALLTPESTILKHKAEEVIIMPNTGADRDYVTPIVIGLSSLLVLGVGILVIKRKILNK